MSDVTELLAAVTAGDAARVGVLVAADPTLANARGEDGLSALMLARYRFDRAVTDILLAADPELDIFEAAALGYVDRLRERLLEDPAAVSSYSPDGFTALHLAAFFGKAEAARMLLEHGAGVDAYTRNAFANQPLHAAAAGKHVEVCRVLLAAGADVNATQHGGYTPLHESAQHGDVEMTELFLSAGADPAVRTDAADRPGESAAGADPALTTDAGETAADLAGAAGHGDLARRLREVVATG